MNRVLLTIAVIAAVVGVTVSTPSLSAHITAASPYTFHRDVLPILEARCGRCHADDSASGLALLHYDSARAATFQIRQRLIRGHMPPWFAEGPFKAPSPLSARELNVLLTWATGGGPEGKPIPRSSIGIREQWPLGPPDLVVPLPSTFTFTDADGDTVNEIALASAKIGGRVIRAVDLAPGTPALVRSAEIVARSSRGEQLLGLWQPGELPAPFALDAGFHLPSNSVLVIRIRHRRIYGAPASDRSEVGICFGSPRTRAIQTIQLTADSAPSKSFTITRAANLLAVRPVDGDTGATVVLTRVGRDQSRHEIARVQLQPEWSRRYVFSTPILMPPGNKIEVSVISSMASLWATLTGEQPGKPGPARVVLEFVN